LAVFLFHSIQLQWLDLFSDVLLKKESVDIQKLLTNFHASSRGLEFSNYFSVELPGTPINSGETDTFKQKLNKHLDITTATTFC
jgi:hypothetical protein